MPIGYVGWSLLCTKMVQKIATTRFGKNVMEAMHKMTKKNFCGIKTFMEGRNTTKFGKNVMEG